MTTLITFDPGYDRLGWAVGKWETQTPIKAMGYGCITTTKKLSLFERYSEIIQELTDILEKFQPTQASIESLFFYSNQTTAMKVAEARGVIINCLLQQKIEIFEYTPLQIKQAVTGYGRADKKAVEKMVRLQLQINPEEKIVDDTLDALAMLITHQVFQSTRHLR